MIDSLYTGLIFTTKVCKFSSELMLHSRSKFSTSSNIINTQQIKHPSDILNFTSRRNILFSRIFNSSLFRSTITTTIPFLCIISLSRLERKKRGAVFSEEERRGRGIPSAYQPEIRIQFFRADGFRSGPRTPPTPTFHHPRPDVLFVARLPQNVTKPRRRICGNKLRGCLDNEERVERKTEKGEEVRGRGNV